MAVSQVRPRGLWPKKDLAGNNYFCLFGFILKVKSWPRDKGRVKKKGFNAKKFGFSYF